MRLIAVPTSVDVTQYCNPQCKSPQIRPEIRFIYHISIGIWTKDIKCRWLIALYACGNVSLNRLLYVSPYS